MQSIPVDGARLGPMLCVVKPQPKLVNIETGEVKKDRDGLTVFTIGVVVRDGYRASVIDIAVSGEPVGIDVGVPVSVVGLTAFAWAMGDRHGTSFRADQVIPAPPTTVPPVKGGEVK
jgi:hypothetical protein